MFLYLILTLCVAAYLFVPLLPNLARRRKQVKAPYRGRISPGISWQP